ncbi:MAG: hypothetical protein O9341_09340, partial [Paucibacter sp.]|nr:hypothetical protein [Roseateles sp.]
ADPHRPDLGQQEIGLDAAQEMGLSVRGVVLCRPMRFTKRGGQKEAAPIIAAPLQARAELKPKLGSE